MSWHPIWAVAFVNGLKVFFLRLGGKIKPTENFPPPSYKQFYDRNYNETDATTLSIVTLSRMTLSIMALSLMALSIMTLSIIIISSMILSIKILTIINDTQNNDT